MFDDPLCQAEATKKVLSSPQGKQTSAKYSVSFWVMVEDMDRSDKALKGIFIRSLSENLKKLMATKEEPETLDETVRLVVQIDNCFH